MSNKVLGTAFERRVCDWFASRGYWVHFITPDSRGAQPFDIIAVKDGSAFAIECKTLSSNRRYFDISRLEQNQILAFDKWIRCGNGVPIVAIEWNDKIYFIDYLWLKRNRKIDMGKEEHEQL